MEFTPLDVQDSGHEGLYPYLMPLIFWLSLAIGFTAILLFLKLGLLGLPALMIALFIQIWVLATNEISGFPKSQDGMFRAQFQKRHFLMITLMLVVLFFLCIMALMGN
ncbi:MAG: hypothetical protein JNN12_15625 [Bacteroidetes Order II. Incertae sedis bacterium]|nr:hypothetical protein [Bacteroidetes Order II. bacterium]